MKRVPATLVGVLAAFQAMACPDEAPDILPLVEDALGDGYRVVELTVTAEDLQQDGPGASYYAEFAATVALQVALYHEVSRGDGYVLVDRLLEKGATVPAFGHAVAACEEGRWTADVSVLEFRLPGGSLFPGFQDPGIAVLEAGTSLATHFQVRREAAPNDVEALRLQDVEILFDDAMWNDLRDVLAAMKRDFAEREAAERAFEREILETRRSLEAAGEGRTLNEIFGIGQ